MTGLRRLIAMALCLAAGTIYAAELVDIGAPFGEVELVDEIICATDTTHGFHQYPKDGATKVETILGEKSLVMPPTGENSYFGYTIGKGKELKAGDAYVLVVEYPEDQPRAFIQFNAGADTILGLATGTTLGDCLSPKYVGRTAEMVDYPLSQKYELSKHFFNLHDRVFDASAVRKSESNKPVSPETEGFKIRIGQFSAGQDPASNGAAVKKIALYRVPNPEKLAVEFKYPPADLPKRHIFWREEMSDNAALGKDTDVVKNVTDWYAYKVNLMKLMGFNTFCKDLLEFGHNQGFDAGKHGGNDWWRTNDAITFLWGDIVNTIGKNKDLYLLPYYEYGGSISDFPENSVGSQCRAMNINGKNKYTHIGWSGAPKCNVDLADPAFIKDAEKLLDCTVVEFKDKVNFLGAWFRPRPEQNPISYNDFDLKLYAKETGIKTTREKLTADNVAEKKYRDWFLGKRREWMIAMRDYLRKNVNPEAAVFYTTDTSEEGVSATSRVVSMTPSAWRSLKKDPKVKARLRQDGRFSSKVGEVGEDSFDKISKNYVKSQTGWKGTWGDYRWDLACPPSDPLRYKNDSGLAMTYTFNRLYTVSDPAGMESFRAKDGLIMIRHYCLNENNFFGSVNGKEQELLGYFCVQFDRAGKYSYLAEARALINGDPRYIGYLAPLSFNKLSPDYARAFNQAFLALPAIPSTLLSDCAKDKNIGVREYKTRQYGTYYAVANLGLEDAKQVRVKLPTAGTVTNLVTGETVPSEDGVVVLDFYSGQVYALNVK